MSDALRVGCIQMNSGNDLDANLRELKARVREAAGAGARLVLTPEYCLLMDGSGRTMRERALASDAQPVLGELCALARQTGAWLLVGSLTVRVDDERMANRSLLISAEGAVVATYDKIHMFDVTLPDGRQIRESGAYRPGDRAVMAATPWGGLGMTVCYDVRFPGLYRALAQAGADFLAVPSSFTAQTGPAHWEVLLRSRAIENTCWVFAPAMCGTHPGNRATHGHSMIVDPWGRVVAEGQGEPCVIYADIDPGAVAKARAMIPSLGHDRSYASPRDGGALTPAAGAATPVMPR